MSTVLRACCRPLEEDGHEPCSLVAPAVRRGAGVDGLDVRLLGGVRPGVKGGAMILLTAIVTVLLFIYLIAAMLRPEWF
jgi:K+-transporting ATPase KdpF subunit